MSTAVIAKSKKTVKLSTVIRNVVNITYKELDDLINNMSSQTGILRTQKLRLFCHRAMKRLAQLLALCKWLSNSDVIFYLKNISMLQRHMSEIEIELAKMQDTLYLTHAGLYSKRFNALEIRSAQDLLAREKVVTLPQHMLLYVPEDQDKIKEWFKYVYKRSNTDDSFSESNTMEVSMGDETLPAMEADSEIAEEAKATLNKKLAEEKLILQLNNMIKVKALYVEGIDIYDQSSYSAVVADGKLVVSVAGYYQLTLTLRHLAEDSPWKLLDFCFLVTSHVEEHLEQKVIYMEEIRRHLVQSLTNACECDRVTAPATAATGAMDGKDNATSMLKPTAGINALLTLCQYTSTAVILRYIFLQGINYARLIGHRQMEVSYYELTNAQTDVSVQIAGNDANKVYNSSVCRFKFWRHESVEGGFRYIIAIKQLRNVSDVLTQYEHMVSDVSGDQRVAATALKPELALVVELQEQTADINGVHQGQSKPRVVPVLMFVPGRSMYDIYNTGVSFQLYKDQVMELCASSKLVYLYSYIKYLYTSHCAAVAANPTWSGSSHFDPAMVHFELLPTVEAPAELHIVFNKNTDNIGSSKNVHCVAMDSPRIVLAVDRQNGDLVLYSNNCCGANDIIHGGVVHQICDTLNYELNSNENLPVKGDSVTSSVHQNARNYLYWLKSEHDTGTEFGDPTAAIPTTDSIVALKRINTENSIENADIFVQLTEFTYFVAAPAVMPAASNMSANRENLSSSDAILSKYSNVKNSVLWCVLTMHECVTVSV